MKHPPLRFAVVVLALLVTANAMGQHAEPADGGGDATAAVKQEAARRFEHAIKLYEDADYALALAEFERVYDLVPHYRVLYNIGQVNMQLGRYARALRTLKEYQARGGDELSSERRKAVQADLALLAGKVAYVSVVVDQPGAEISIDGVVVGTSPLADELIVDVGERTLRVRLAGYEPRNQVLSLAGGDHRDTRFLLEREAVAPPPASPPPSTQVPSPNTTPLRPPRLEPQPVALEPKPSRAWIGWTATGALTAGAVVAGVLGASAASELDTMRDRVGVSRADWDDARSRARTRFLVADVLAASAIVSGGITLYLQLSSGTSSKASQAPLQIALNPRGLSVALHH